MYRSHVTYKCQFLPSTVYTVRMLYAVPIWTGYIFTQVAALTPSVSDGLWHEAVASIPMSGTSSALSTSMSRSSSLMAPAHTLTHSLCHRGIYSCNHRCMYCGTCTWISEASIKFALMIAPQNVLEPNPPPLPLSHPFCSNGGEYMHHHSALQSGDRPDSQEEDKETGFSHIYTCLHFGLLTWIQLCIAGW